MAGHKDFVTGNTITESDLDDILGDQLVFRFASSAARSASSLTPAEGHLSWLEDTNTFEYYTGSAWASLAASIGAGILTEVGTTALTDPYSISVTGLTVGNGSWDLGLNSVVGNRVMVSGVFTFGSTSAVSGELGLQIPVTAADAFGAAMGLKGMFYDSGGSQYPVVGTGNTTANVRMRVCTASGTYLTATAFSSAIPKDLTAGNATGDVLTFVIEYTS